MTEVREERGGWVDTDGGGRRWKGPMSWTDRFGPSSVTYLLGRPHYVTEARLPDGTPVPRVERWCATDDGVMRRPDGEGGYLLGRIEIGPDSVVFADDPVLNEAVRTGEFAGRPTALLADLASDAAFMERLEDDAVADALYSVFCNRDWRRESDGERHSVSWRRAGSVVAWLRRKGESYTDWYPDGPGMASPDAVAEVEAALAALGWKEPTLAQVRQDCAEALARLAEAETLPAGTFPAGHAAGGESLEGDTPYRRLRRARAEGRIDEDGFAWIYDRIIHAPVEAVGDPSGKEGVPSP